jgi:hypothetical protein
MKHTPGPWEAHFEEAYFVTGPDLGRVAMMMNIKGARGLGGRRSGDESAANARLIAAAPDLLAALEGLEKEFRRIYPIYYSSEPWCHETNAPLKVARAAIAKATGELK